MPQPPAGSIIMVHLIKLNKKVCTSSNVWATICSQLEVADDEKGRDESDDSDTRAGCADVKGASFLRGLTWQKVYLPQRSFPPS